MVNVKEKREIVFMVSAVLIVAVAGLILENVATSGIQENFAGAAISLDSDVPTYSGILYLLEEACVQVEPDSSSTCNEICEAVDATCVPLEDNCDEVTGEYLCHCCSDLSEWIKW